MTRKLSQGEFIAAASRRHGGRYDYSRVEYKTSKANVEIICAKHGAFWQAPCNHIRGNGCPACTFAQLSRQMTHTLEQFIARARQRHGDRYDYSLVEYKGSNTKVEILCPEHGSFWQTPHNHSKKTGCPICGTKQAYTAEQFITCARQRHGDRYDYSRIEYKGSDTKVEIVCLEHGSFMQLANNHLRGARCPRCARQQLSQQMTYTAEQFIACARQRHGDRYDYSRIEYKDSDTKVEIVCLKHGSFVQNPACHISGQGCPTCKSSKGEILIAKILTAHNVKYASQAKIGCRNKNELPFDFCTEFGVIEFQGKQHYTPVSKWGGEAALRAVMKRDKIKRDWCRSNNIPLLIIPYWYKENRIEYEIRRFCHLTNTPASTILTA